MSLEDKLDNVVVEIADAFVESLTMLDERSRDRMRDQLCEIMETMSIADIRTLYRMTELWVRLRT